MVRKSKQTELAFNDLFRRTYVVEKWPIKYSRVFDRELPSLEKFSKMYSLGGGYFKAHPTYQLQMKNFSKFVEDLKRVNKLQGRIQRILTGESYKLTASEMQPTPADMKAIEAGERFQVKYKDALEALTFEKFFDEHMRKGKGRFPRGFINMQLLPRTKAERDLFMSFVLEYLKFDLTSRLHITGPKQGTQSIPKNLERMADRMRRTGKGKKSGSHETITETLLKKMGFIKDTPEWERRHDSLYKTLGRHFKDIGI